MKFHRYLSRRFHFLEQFPGYNYNSGLGAGLDTNSVALGQTLVDSMIEEVTQMCNQQAWASKVYQQVSIIMCCNVAIGLAWGELSKQLIDESF